MPADIPITDRALVLRAIHNAHHGRELGVRWSHVADAFAVGSTYATILCQRAGLDPNEMVGREPWEVPDAR